jgi:hypothetical protein
MTTRQAYVNAVVTNYVRLPGTPTHASRGDRRLAAALYERRIPLRVIWAAFVLAAARWSIRSPQQGKLAPIRTLYYFLPAIDEILTQPPEPDYIQYLALKLRPYVADKEQDLIVVSHTD